MLCLADDELEGIFSEEEDDLEINKSLSTTSRSSSESSGFNSDDSSIDNPAESAAGDTDGETPNLSETESDSFSQSDDEQLVCGASGEQEAMVRKNFEKVKKQDKYGSYNFGEKNRNY